jgi:hypothetical protein
MDQDRRRTGLHKTELLSHQSQISHLIAGLTDDGAATVFDSYGGTTLSFQTGCESAHLQRRIGLHLCGL